MGEAANKPKTPVHGRGLAFVAANHYSSDLRAYLSRRLGNPHDVEDVAQSVFLKLVRINNDNLVVEKPFGFVRTIANRALAELSALRARDRAHLVSSSRIEHIVESAVATDSDEDPGEDLDVHQQIETAMAKLSPTLSAALILVARDGLSYAEAAQRLDISEHAVKKNLQRARAQLRRRLFPGNG
ncbi:MAG: RNA polymerase sigma factor [Steroidobacteraceae bacterium]